MSNAPFIADRRPPFFRFVWRLYTTHDTFRGLVEFTVIGLVVVMFLEPPPLTSLRWMFDWVRSRAAEIHLTERLAPLFAQSDTAQKQTTARESFPSVSPADTQPAVTAQEGPPAAKAPQLATHGTPSNSAPTATPAPTVATQPVTAGVPPGAFASTPSAAGPQSTMPNPPAESPPTGAPALANAPQSAATPTPPSNSPAPVASMGSPQATPGPQPSGGQQVGDNIVRPAAVTTGAAMPLVEEVRRPRLTTSSVLEFDDHEFDSSLPEDRQRLAKAVVAFRAGRADEVLDDLVGATLTDPNVNYIRAVGLVLEPNTDRLHLAEDLLRAAASGGHQRAATLLGIGLVEGLSRTKDVEEGRKLIESAAAHGDRLAQRIAGLGYLNGQFVTIDAGKGAAFLKQAVDAGDTSAMLHYAYLLSTGTGVEKNEGLAEKYVRMAANAGLTAAQETLGQWIVERYKVALISDPAEGVRWLEAAYQSGYSISALWRLSLFYLEIGRGSWKSLAKAVTLLNTCVPFAFSYCQYTYAYCLKNGLGYQRDVAKAYARYEAARLLGAVGAPRQMESMQRMLTNEEKSSALELAKSIRNELKPIPRKLILQVSEAPRPPSPWPAR
jgi:TPR repeat protein